MPKNPPAMSAIWLSGPRALGRLAMTSIVSAIRLGRSVTAGFPSRSASCMSPGDTRSTGSRKVAIIRVAASADLVIWGITARIGSSTSSMRRFIRLATAFRLSMVWRNVCTTSRNPLTTLRNCSTVFDIAAIGLLEPKRLNRSPTPGVAGRGGGVVAAIVSTLVLSRVSHGDRGVVLHGRAGADEVAVTSRRVDAADRWEVLGRP